MSALMGSLPASARGDDALWYRSLGIEEGLSQNFVTAIAQVRSLAHAFCYQE